MSELSFQGCGCYGAYHNPWVCGSKFERNEERCLCPWIPGKCLTSLKHKDPCPHARTLGLDLSSLSTSGEHELVQPRLRR